MDTRIEPGHCWVTGKAIYEIVSVWPDDHPLKGHVRQVGKILPTAVKITFLLLDGNRMTLELHKSAEKINLNEIWHLLLEKENHEYLHRQYLPNFNKKEAEKAHNIQIKLLCPPLSILDIELQDEIRVTL